MGKGLYNNAELVDTIIVDLNSAIREIASGQYVQACRIVTAMSQKLVNLRKTIDEDLKSRDSTIEDLKRELRNLGHEIVEVSGTELGNAMEKDGAE